MTGALAALVGGLLWPPSDADAGKHGPPGTAASPSAATGSALVAGYTRWQRVNSTPHRVWSRFAVLCRAVTPQESALDASDPHKDKYVTVYVNGAGAAAMLHAKTPVFPQATVIVKQKAATAGGPPELLTVMHKRGNGYDPAAGDWQYLVLDGRATTVTVEGRLPTCRACHAQWRRTDSVSRAYLPAALAKALR